MAALEDLDDPGDDASLDHACLGALPQTELLKRSESILAKVGIIAALLVQSVDQHANDVLELEQVAASLILIS